LPDSHTQPAETRQCDESRAQGGDGIERSDSLLQLAMQICLAYDCLYPYTVGGAERWYRNLALALAAAGHEVTYLTRRQWPRDEQPDLPGVRVVVVSREDPLYDADGKRRIAPPLRFGAGVLRHLLANRRRYDAVHLCSFPYFSLLGARLGLAGRRLPIGVDWFEVWSREYWREYLGPVGGTVGELVQRLCARLTPQAYVFSELHASRLAEQGLTTPPLRLAGLYAGPTAPRDDGVAERAPLVVFAGRHIPEKRPQLVPAAVAAARGRVPGLRGLVLGDGPLRPAVLEAVAQAGEFVEAPGFVAAEVVQRGLAQATCHVLPSSREGYGLVVIEAAAFGTPTVVVAGTDNAAVELIEPGVNGYVADSPEQLADAIVAVHEGGQQLRRTTAQWFAEHAPALSVQSSMTAILRQLERPNDRS
jgi:glycosyltransferase involved in cell wall biosynthesis